MNLKIQSTKFQPLFRPTDTWTDKSFTLAVFQINTRGFLLLFYFIFNFKDQLTTTLSQEDQQAQAQTYIPSKKFKPQHSRYGGFQGNCLGTANKLGEDVVLLNVEN